MKPLYEKSRPAKTAHLGNLIVDNRQHLSLAQLLRWRCEAVRLLNEFLCTGERRHLDAFVVHMIGMRDRLITRGV